MSEPTSKIQWMTIFLSALLMGVAADNVLKQEWLIAGLCFCMSGKCVTAYLSVPKIPITMDELLSNEDIMADHNLEKQLDRAIKKIEKRYPWLKYTDKVLGTGALICFLCILVRYF